MPVKSYCAGMIGNDYVIIPDFTINKSVSFKLEISESEWTSTLNMLFGIVGTSNCYLYHRPTERIRFNWGGDYVDFLTLGADNTGVNCDVVFLYDGNPTGTNNFTCICYNRDTQTTYSESTTVNTSTFADVVLDNIGNGADSFYITGKVWNVKMTLNDVLVLSLPLQGSTYDISGNGNHGVNSGCDLTAVQDNFHYNLREGFGKGVSSDFIPKLADNSGFPATVTEEHFAGTWNNMPESYFRFPNLQMILWTSLMLLFGLLILEAQFIMIVVILEIGIVLN